MPVQMGFDVIWNPELVVFANAFFASSKLLEQGDSLVREIALAFSRELAENFDAEGRPSGWEPLALSTILKRGSDHPILQDSGDLVAAATDPESWNFSRSGQTFIGTLSTPGYGKFHITGTRFMPMRDWTYLSPEFDEVLDTVLNDWMDNALQPIEALPA